MTKLLVTKEWFDNNTHLASMKESVNHSGLYVLKYNKKVFYNNLWTPELEQCRGLVIDKDFNVVVRPFDKVFNYGENNTQFNRDDLVVYTRKVNGFLGCVTNTENYGTLFSTTGSLDSKYVELVKKWLDNETVKQLNTGVTWCFEICDESDPHIIKEDFGAYLIGAVCHKTGRHYSEYELDEIAFNWDFKRMFCEGTCEFSDVVKKVKDVTHEGYMVRLFSDEQQILKIKSPYYLTKKFFARKPLEKLINEFKKPETLKKKIDEEFYPLVDKLVANSVEFSQMNEQQRIKYIEDFLHG